MAVPLRVIVLVIVIVVAAVSALVVYFPNASATNDAIDTLVTELRTETSSNLVLIARSQFTPVLTLAQTMLSYLSQGSLNATDGTRLRSWAPLFCALGNTSVYLVQAGNAAKDYVGCQAGLTYYRDPVTTNLYTGVALPPLYPFPGVPQMTLMSTNYNPTTRPWYVALKNKNGWSSFYVRTGNPPTSTTAVGGPFYDAAGNVAGAMSVSMHSLSFIAAMKAVRVGLTGRAMVYDVKSGYFLAGNFNQSATVTANVTTGAQRLVWINDTRDDLIVAAVSQLGGQDALLALPSTFATSFGWQDDVVYVDITPIQDSFGLDLRLLTAIRRSDFTSDIAQQQSRAAGGAGGAVAGLAILCGLMIWAMMSPLNRLAADMNVRDSMSSDDGRNGDSRSVLSEIAEIQEAYSGLRQELQRVKSYLPQSVLRQLERGDDDDDADLVASERRSASLQRFDTASISSKHTSKSASIHNQARVLGLGSTRASSHGKDLPGAVIATMEAALAVSKRRVSMIAINVKGFHSEVMAKGETHVTTFASNFVKLLNDVATAHRGVTHLMHGDRVFLSFNAATRVAGHATQAVQAAVTIRSRAAAELKAQLTAGVATGEALVGMLGSSAQRQFTVLGKVFLNAAVLERLCSLNGFLLNTGGDAPIDGILVDRSTALPAGDTVPMRVVDVVALPQARRLQCIYTMVPTAVSAVNKEEESGADAPGEVLPNAHAETSGDGEWMYELTRARQRNPYAVYNDAMDHCTQDKHEDARQMLQAMDHPAPVMRALRDAALLRVAQLQQATTASVAMEWGVYYHSLVFVAPSA